MNKELFQLIILHEGVRLKPYRDTVGKLTIGIGRNLDDVGISNDEALELLKNDVSRTATALFAAFPWIKTLSEVRIAVLLDMAFNMGVGRLKGFKKFLKFMQDKDFDSASAEMLNSKWAVQVGARAKRLSEMVKTSEWPQEVVK